MADDDATDDDFEGAEPDADLEEDLDEDELVDDELVDETEIAVEPEDLVVAEVEEPVAEPEVVPARARKTREEDGEDEDDEVDPDDVEADLDTILKDRIAATEDEEDEDETVEVTRTEGPPADGVTPKKANEFVCTGCFLLVNPAQFGKPSDPRCPVGEEDCPAMVTLFGSRKAAKRRS
jgi:hypothetical protein